MAVEYVPRRPTLEALAALPTSVLPEPTLISGYYGVGSETRACVCGGWIVTPSGSPSSIAFAVAAHADEPLHAAWRAREGL